MRAHIFTGTLGVGILLAMAACQTAHAPVVLIAPGTRVELSHFAGSPLSGPQKGRKVAVVAKDCLELKMKWVALDKMPERGLEPLGAKARLIVAERSRRQVLPTTRLTLRAQVGNANNLADKETRSKVVSEETGALPAGVTLSCRLADPVRVSDPVTGADSVRYVRVEAYRAGGGSGVVLAVTVQDLVASTADEEDFVVSGGGRKNSDKPVVKELQRETALLDPTTLKEPVAIVVPFALAGTQTRAVGVVVEVESSPGNELLSRDAATAAADLAKTNAQDDAIPTVSASWSAITSAMGSLGKPEFRRPALVFLANETHATLLGDLALVADPDVLAKLVERIRKDTSTAADPAALGWALDRETFELLCDLQAQPKFPKELEAVLAVHAGEAARHGSSLDEIRRGLGSRADFTERLLSENQIFLEDSSPASRIRACAWLEREGHGVPGFDPLGKPKDRRAALDAFVQGAAGSSQTQPATMPATAPIEPAASEPAGGAT